MEQLNIESDDFMTHNAGTTMGVYGSNSVGRAGRPTHNEAHKRNRDVQHRNELRDSLARAGMTRPEYNTRSGTYDRHNRMVID